MKLKRVYLILSFVLLIVISTNTTEANAMQTGFSTEELYEETKNMFVTNINILPLSSEPQKNSISFLDAINDQPSLLQGIIRLESRSLHYQWNDTLLFPAFLACGDWQRSDMVLSACIEQHSLDSGIDIDTVPQEDMDIYLSKYINVYRSWERKKLEEYDEFSKGYLKRYFSYLEHIRARDEEWRKTYLAENYARNMKICKRKHFVK